MTNNILIYGADDALMRKAALEQHEKHPDMQVKLCRAAGFNAEKLRPAKEVIVIDNFPEIGAAYEGTATVTIMVIGRDQPSDDQPVLAKTSKRTKKEEA